MTSDPEVNLREYFVTCATGLERVVAEELKALGAQDVRARIRGVSCRGEPGFRYRANLRLRAAIRVLEPILSAETITPGALYEAVRQIDWKRYMTVRHTLSVDARVRDSRINHSQFAALKVKDAIVDQFRGKCGERPTVNIEDADVPVHLHLFRDRATLLLDTSGTSLHRRGYRGALVRSPLNEALAAGILYLTGWDRKTPLADPMCGSGTIPIEAALMAADVAPGLFRKKFPFQSWPDFDRGTWKALVEEVRTRALRKLPFPIYASDHHGGALSLARKTAHTAGVESMITFSVCDISDFRPTAPTMVLNPPYGLRLDAETDLPGLYAKIGETLRGRPGTTAWILSGNRELTQYLGLRSYKSTDLMNGDIPCRLLAYKIHHKPALGESEI
jgi:putative N6-adenine-specific DNA methylase